MLFLANRLSGASVLVFTFHIFIVFSLSVLPSHVRVNSSGLEAGIDARDASGPLLRILCLGASITWGQGSTTGNGYRKDLRDLLTADSYAVHFVGTQTSGNMANNANEGYPGFRIDQVTQVGAAAYGYLPNVVLIHLGTNDFVQGYDPNTSANRMGTLIDNIHNALPDSLAVVSKLLPNKGAKTEQGIESFNSLLDGVVSQRQQNGVNVILVDMHSSEFSLADLGPDGTHPTDAGYQKMAGVWHDALKSALSSNSIPAPQDNGLSDSDDSNNVHCAFTSSSVSSLGSTQFGFGNKTAVWKGAWLNKGDVLNKSMNTGLKYGGSVLWTDLTGDGRDDYVYFDPSGSGTVFDDRGDERFQVIGQLISKDNRPACDYSNIWLADMTGDGKIDFVCIMADGSIAVYSAPGPNASYDWSTSATSTRGSAAPRANVHIADMDGDGISDYVFVKGDGSVCVSYNRVTSWTGVYCGTAVAEASQAVDRVRFVDLNGDARADLVILSSQGGMEGWMNFRGASILQPNFYSSGTVLKDIKNGIGPANMTFGIVRAATRKQDLLTVHGDGSVKLFENRGYNGIAYGEYCRYCDMLGAGSDSYLTMGLSGSLKLYANLHNGGFHIKYGQILGDQHLARADVHLADINGDGRCDYIHVDNSTGTVQWRQNQGVTTDGTTGNMQLGGWTDIAVANAPRCTAAGVRFADVNGDGFAYYICISYTGQVSISINDGKGGFSISGAQFSISDDLNTFMSLDAISFADIDGDGNADYLFFDGSSGSVSARMNTGKGSSFAGKEQIYSNSALVNGFLRFANLGGLGRADMINIDTLSAKAKTSYNRCPNRVPPALSGSGGGGGGGGGNYSIQAVITFPDSSCDSTKQALIREEMQYAAELAVAAQTHLQDGVYYEHFFSQDLRDDNDFAQNTARNYELMAQMLSGSGYSITATCTQTTYCKTKGWLAHMKDDSKGKTGNVNFCDNFFTKPELQSTRDILSTCASNQPDLRTVQRAYSAIIIHELSHTSFAMAYAPKSLDFAYGFNFCTQLSAGTFDRSCMTSRLPGKHKVLCPDSNGNEGICPASKSGQNADTFSFVAAGIYFSQQCNTAIPLPPPPPKARRHVALNSKRASCPDNDFILFELDNGVGTYAHFGDSYAAGMGTATTSGDSCRVGSNNFGRLLHAYLDDASVSYDEHACSGDTVTGLDGQIDNWQNPTDTSFATLSIGGNDVGFSDLVWYCVITPNTARFGSTNRANCEDSENKARQYMSDAGGLKSALSRSYTNIVSKAQNDDFKLYVTSYPTFFNVDTTDCEKTSFHYWFGGYNPYSDFPLNRIVYLTTDLRKELNALVTQLNGVIKSAIDSVNSQYSQSPVVYVDINPYYDSGSHRWCENPNAEFHEPNAGREETDFFLSGWSDVSIPGSAAATAAVEATEVSALISAGNIPLPDALTCNQTFGNNLDPYAYSMCQVSIAIHEGSDEETSRYQRAENDIKSGNYSSQDVPWYVPTRQIKTFHPRSPGMVLYQQALVDAMTDQGQL